MYPALDARLSAVLGLVPPCGHAADIGANHGLLAVRLLMENRCERVTAADVSAPALTRARALIARCGVGERAALRVADGLDALNTPAQAIILAGMGAETMIGILSRGAEKRAGAALILQANRDLERLRAWLCANRYRIDAERLARASGRFYVVLRAVTGEAAYDEKELLLGPCLLRDGPEGFSAYLDWRLRVARRAQAQLARAERADAPALREKIHREITLCEEALAGLWRREAGANSMNGG